MYAVVKIGGRQYRVAEGDVMFVDRRHEETGQSFTLDRVLLINDEDSGVNIGTPVIEGAAVEATLVDQVKADKVIVFKKKRRKGYKKKNGQRQPLSQIRIESISAASSNGKKAKEEEVSSGEEETDQELSTDMTAKEAVEHIRNTPLNQLEGFVPDSEERVTVQKAWEAKEEG
jgi:large subunit ribosomal protein L21